MLVKLHDSVVINPHNVVMLLKQSEKITFMLTNGKAHALNTSDPDGLMIEWGERFARMGVVLYHNDRVSINIDQILSMFLQPDKIVMNLGNGNSQFFGFGNLDPEEYFNDIIAEINRLDKENN